MRSSFWPVPSIFAENAGSSINFLDTAIYPLWDRRRCRAPFDEPPLLDALFESVSPFLAFVAKSRIVEQPSAAKQMIANGSR